MNIKQYLDSTYLKTPEQAGLSETENTTIVQQFIQEAIDEDFKLIMIRPDKVKMARKMIDEQKSKVLVGTVISFPEGTNSLEEKLNEAQQAVQNGVDELDFVCNYEAFKNGDIYNDTTQNQGSAKVFSFAKINNLSKADTLLLFAEHYRAVINNVNGTDHQNIRQFMQHGWSGIEFESDALKAKV